MSDLTERLHRYYLGCTPSQTFDMDGLAFTINEAADELESQAETIALLREDNAALAKRVADNEWQPISKAPEDDEAHLRGLFVFNNKTNETRFEVFLGYINEDTGEFVDMDGDVIGWCAEDFEYCKPLGPPPEPDQ